MVSIDMYDYQYQWRLTNWDSILIGPYALLDVSRLFTKRRRLCSHFVYSGSFTYWTVIYLKSSASYLSWGCIVRVGGWTPDKTLPHLNDSSISQINVCLNKEALRPVRIHIHVHSYNLWIYEQYNSWPLSWMPSETVIMSLLGTYACQEMRNIIIVNSPYLKDYIPGICSSNFNDQPLYN